MVDDSINSTLVVSGGSVEDHLGISSVNTLEEYLQKYGTHIGRQAQKSLNPYHVPERDAAFDFDDVKRKPFPAQAHVITAAVKFLKHGDRAVGIVAEQGTGKSLISIVATHKRFLGKPYRAIIMCPPHLVHKWEREIRKTLHGAHVIQLRDVSQLTVFDKNDKPDCAEWWIVKENAAKTGSAWKPVYNIGRNDVPICSSCMKMVCDKNGLPISPNSLEANMMTHDFSPGSGDEASKGCGSQLWSYCRTDSGRAAWAIAKYARTHLKRFFDMFIVDEAHEERGRTSARGTAMAQLASASKQCMMLTGTFVGGYAWQLRTLLLRLSPHSLVEEGYDWTNETAFNEEFGRIETKITKTEDNDSGGSTNKRSQGKKTTTRKSIKPGIMPTLFGRHLMRMCVFLSLDELADNLPTLREQTISVPLDADVRKEYNRIEEELRKAIKPMIAKGDKRLLGMMLRVLLTYPDHPYGFEEIGYTERGIDDATGEPFENFVPVVKPKDFPPNPIRNKQRELVEFIKKEHAEKRQCWVYVQDTNKYDIQHGLARALEAEGLRVKILHSNTVATEDREEWIEENGCDCDVIISHPQLVQTGLDLFSPNGTHNFCTLIFFQTGYDLYVLRQAGRRAWRIGQGKPCKVVYFYFADTMQQQAMTLMGKKLVASEAIEGKFTAEGLAAMSGDDDTMEMALAKSLMNKMEDIDGERTWSRITSVVHGSEKATNTSTKPESRRIVTDDGIVIEHTRQINTKTFNSLFDVTRNKGK